MHLLIDCDSCKKYYHIHCLDPPLTVVPKKTKLYGWECSKCVLLKNKSSSDDEILEQKSSRGKREKKTKPLASEVDLSFSHYTNSKSKKPKHAQHFSKKVKKNSRKTKPLLKFEIEKDKLSQISNASAEAIYIDDDESSIQH